ncbi:MAG: hypothetical protein QE277_12070 [Flectobacillus sp.]|nr:hypothetical protein [Flectobacillus sp.]
MDRIDKELKDKLLSYERKPRPEAWSELSARMNKKPKPILPLWSKYLAACLCLILGCIGWLKMGMKIQTLNSEGIAAYKENRLIYSKEKEPIVNKLSEPNLSGTVPKTITKPKMVVEDLIKEDSSTNVITTIVADTLVQKEQSIVSINSNPEEGVILVNMVDEEEDQTDLPVLESTPENVEKQRFIAKLWKRFKKLKSGEEIEWKSAYPGLAKLFARADTKINNTRDLLIKREE